VLLTTPLIRSLKSAWPDTQIDILVFEGTEGVIAANPDIRNVITVPERPDKLAHLAFLWRMTRRYDIALSTLHGDRSTMYAFLVGRWRAGLLHDNRKERWKRHLLHRWLPFDDLNTHTVRMNLALADPLNIDRNSKVVPSWHVEEEQHVYQLLRGNVSPIAVLHAFPKFNYKMWSRDGWIAVARWLADRGYLVALSGGRDAAEVAYVADLAVDMPTHTLNLAGKLSLGASAYLVSRAAIYVGLDTALTHVAAALGVPTIALYGPTNPVKWGPWPYGQAADTNPWRRHGSQRAGNVTLLQGVAACVPCTLEGCGREISSFSDCLLSLPAAKVIAAIEERLR